MRVALFLYFWLFSLLAWADSLVLYTWPEYMDPDLLERFEKESGVRVTELHYVTDESKDELLLRGGDVGIDLMVTSSISMYDYINSGWLASLNKKKLKNLSFLDPVWATRSPELDKYGVPFLWGTLGIVYRTDLISTEVSSWKHLFEPNESLKNKIMMIDDSREALGAALKALGFKSTTQNVSEIRLAEELLRKQKPYVQDYSYFSLSDDSELISGKVWMAMAYSGDALTLSDLEPSLRYVVPKEGTILWSDYIVVMEKSEKKELAHKFINFLNRPENAAQLATYLSYPTPNKEAEKFLSAEHLSNPVIYPPKSILGISETFEPQPQKINLLRNQIFSSVIYSHAP